MTLPSLRLTGCLDRLRLHRTVSGSHRTRTERIALATHYLRACALIFAPIIALSAQSPPTATIDGRLLRPGVDTFYMVSYIRGHADTTGRIVQSLVRRTIAGRPVWLQTYRFDDRKDLSTIDSLTMDLRTLLPITEVRYNNMGNAHVGYTSARVRAVVKLSSGKRTVRDTSVQDAVYSSSMMDALARAIPAKPGNRTRVSMFYPFPAPFRIISSEFTTIGTDTLPDRTGQGAACWVIKIVLPEGFTRFWVSKSNHDLLRTVSGEGATSVMFVR